MPVLKYNLYIKLEESTAQLQSNYGEEKKKEKKSTNPSKLMNNDTTKEIRTVLGVRNAQA